MSRTDESAAGPSPSVDHDERDYLLARAAAHRQLAETAGEHPARIIHAQFQRLYEARAHAIGMVDNDQDRTQEY